MNKTLTQKMEQASIEIVHEMCIESLPPDLFEKWELVHERLLANRQALKKLIELTCMGCGETFMGVEPKMCCSGRDCGCMGMPIEPVICSEECYYKLPGVTKPDQK
jgi:hypothetical protein